jgi:hypothetical protein
MPSLSGVCDSSGGPFGDQLTWLEADLIAATANRKDGSVPWIVVSGHRPLYSSYHSNQAAIAAFEPLFLKYNVDIYFAGHVHWFGECDGRTWCRSTAAWTEHDCGRFSRSEQLHALASA